MTRNLEARLDGSTPGESRLSKSAHPWEEETPRMREVVLGTAPGACGPYPCGPQASPLILEVAISRILSLLAFASRGEMRSAEQMHNNSR